MPKVSIIIPVYNTSKYLEKCLNSLINQTLKDIEIICVNDGSTDNSLSILEKYAQKDPRVIIRNQKNAGQSSARNNGIKIASGDYIGFIDSDDFVDLNFYEKLYNAATENNSDISCATIIRKRPNSEKYRVYYSNEDVFIGLKEKLQACNIPKCCYVWNKIYKTTLVKDYPFKEGVYFEDILWIPEIIKQSNKIVSVPNTNYYYVVNSGSTVKKNSSKKQTDSYNAKKYIIKFFDENGIKLSQKERTITKSINYLFNIPIMKVKEYGNTEKFYLFGCFPVFKKSV
ncbi:glycosyltransferase [bacterium]|nr:glycosyltransferase [bacterium]